MKIEFFEFDQFHPAPGRHSSPRGLRPGRLDVFLWMIVYG